MKPQQPRVFFNFFYTEKKNIYDDRYFTSLSDLMVASATPAHHPPGPAASATTSAVKNIVFPYSQGQTSLEGVAVPLMNENKMLLVDM